MSMPAIQRHRYQRSPTTAILIVVLLASMSGAEPTPAAKDSVQATLDGFRAANLERSAQARETAAWNLERQRLTALIVATKAETARLERDAANATAARDAARTRLAALGTGSDLDAVRARLVQAGDKLKAALTTLAVRLPPGIVPALAQANEDSFDAGMRALESAERAASTVTVEVVTGVRSDRANSQEAVKILRVAGAAAWWVSLDGAAAGTVRVVDGAVRLTPAGDVPGRIAIITALAQAEGRAQPGVVLLPDPTVTRGRP